MNERIKLLAEQAGIQMFEDRAFGWSVIAGTDHNVQRFVELIVAECVGVCKHYRGTAGDQAAEYIGQGIQEHFGVEL